MKVLYLSTNGDTTTVLPYPLELQGYGCAVIDMNGKITSPKSGSNGPYDNLYLCCNIVEESLVENVKMPILQTIIRRNNIVSPGQIHNLIWLKVMRPSISNIRLYIADKTGDIISLSRNKLNCTLLFVPNPTE